MRKFKFIFAITAFITLTNCNSGSDSTPEELVNNATNTETMFSKLQIKWDHTYTWKEFQMSGSSSTPYTPTGNTGQITFIKPNIIKEIYNGNTYQTTFVTSNYAQDRCDLVTPDWHNKPSSPFINNVDGIYIENSQIVWSYCNNSGGVYNCKKISFTP